MIVFLFVGGTWDTNSWDQYDNWGWGYYSVGLIAVCVFFAAIALLFTARYPRGLYDFVMGMNRWAIRVSAYAALMTDTYPPFRLDQGGAEPTEPENA